MEKGKGKEALQSDSNAEDDLKPNDTTLVLRNFFQQILLKDQSTPSQTNEDESYLNTAQVVEKLAHKEPALLYFYHKVFPNPNYEKVVTEMVAKVIHDANESAKSPRMKPRSYVPPPNVCRPRTSDLFDKTSTEDEDETEARKLVLLSNLKGILREATVLNELQDESQARSESARKMGVGRRVDVPYTPPSTSQTIETAGTVNGQKSQAARSSDPAVKETVATLPPPPSVVLGLKSDGSEQNCSQASSSKGKGVETTTTNEQDNHVVPTSSSNPVNGKIERESFAPSENVLTPEASTSKGKTAEKVDEQKHQAAPKEKESVTLPPPPPPPVVDFKFESKESHQKHSTSTQASTSKGKNVETINEQNNRPTPIRKSSASVNAAEKAALSALVIDFISKADNQKYFAFGQASTSNGKSTEKVNTQKEAAPSSDPINIKVKVAPPPPSAAADLKPKEQSRSAEASTSNGKSTTSADHIKTKVEKDGFDLPPPPPDEDLISKESGQKRATRSSTQASTQAASKPDPVKIKVEQEKTAPPPPPPTSPPPVRCRPRMADIRQQEEIYVTSAHARERADKSRLRQAQDAHLRSGGRVVPKPEPVNSNPTQEEVKPKPTPTEKGKEKEKEKEEKKPEPIPTPATQSASGSKASSSKPETTAKPEPKPTENKSTKDTSSPKVSSGTQTDPPKEPKPTGSFYAPREETRYQYEYRPASSPPPKPRYEGQRGESASSNKYGRPLPARGASYTAQCSGITNEGRRCLIRVTTSFDGVSLEPYCQWHGEYYGSTKPKSLDPNKKERGRCSATTLKGTLCKRNADHYSSKSEYGYCWQHERMYGWNSVYS